MSNEKIWKPLPVETWEEETLRLLNENELGEALNMFRRYHGMVTRFLCSDCGAITHTSTYHGCLTCGCIELKMVVVIDKKEAVR